MVSLLALLKGTAVISLISYLPVAVGEGARLQTRYSERYLETTMLRSEMQEGQPHCQSELLRELKQHVTAY